MSLIAMAVHAPEGSGRHELTDRTLTKLFETVDLANHRLFVIDNGSCKAAKTILDYHHRTLDFAVPAPGRINFLTLPENIGTAKAINLAWKQRMPGELCVKMDDDVVIHQRGWLEQMEEAIRREPSIGIIGLKRKDCEESPLNTHPWYHSTIHMLPHEPGERWMVVEDVHHVMGTCQGYSPALLDAIGFLNQPGLYGFDDSLASVRAHVAGFKTVFLHGIEIDHIDPGGTDYTKWKCDHAGEKMAEYNFLVQEYRSGRRSVYAPPD